MNQHYNIALVPSDLNFANYVIELAQSNFAKYEDGYLLSNNTLPHITLCQFKSSQQNLGLIWDLAQKELNKGYYIRFDGFYLNVEQTKSQDYIWAGLSVKRDPNIINLQKKIYTILSNCNCEILTSSTQYFPHLTFSRFRYRNNITILNYPSSNVFIEDYLFIGSTGISDERGGYKKVILLSRE
jgi:2'-5' RNA ligase